MTVERTGGALKRGHCRAGIAGAGGAGRCIAYIVRFLGNGLALLLTLASAGVAAGPAGQSDSESTMGRGVARPATLDCADWDAGTFFEAAGPRDVAACLDVGVDLDHGLRQAVANAGDPATVQRLIDAGANPNVAGTVAGRYYDNRGHWHPLYLALARNRGSAVIRILLDAGADILAEDSTGRTALAYAPWALRVSAEDLRILAAAARTKVGFEQRDSWDLVHAILEEDGSRLQALLAAGADPDSPVSGGGRLMDVAARFGSAAAVQSLVAAGADPSAANELGAKPLLWAVHGDDADAVRALIGEGADPDHMGDWLGPTTALQYAARVGGPDVLTALLEGGGDADVTDENGDGLLHYVLDRAVPDVESAAALMAARARALIAGGVSPDAKDKMGITPLYDALRIGAWPDLIRVLVEGGANPRQRDEFGRTVLHWAAQGYRQGDPGRGYPDAGDVIGFLVDAGAPVAGRDTAGRTALHVAAKSWEPGPAAGMIRALVANGVEIDARDEYGNTALHLAAASRSPHAPAAITALMDLGADTRRLNARGETAWNVAAENEDVRQSEAYWRLNDARFAQGRDGRGRAGEPVPSVAPEAERVARTKGPSACEIPGFPNALDARRLGLGWCPSGVDFQVRVLALQAAGAWCGILGETSATPAQIDAREAEIVAACDRLDALAAADSGPSCRCAPDYRP